MQALASYDRLAEASGQSMPEVWSRLAGCHQALGNYDASVGAYLKILEGDSILDLWYRASINSPRGMVSPSYHAAMGNRLRFLKAAAKPGILLNDSISAFADLSFGAEAHAEAATALAELYVALGQPKAALEILYSLQGVGAVLSPASPSIWPLHWRRASLFMKLGHVVSCLPMCHLTEAAVNSS